MVPRVLRTREQGRVARRGPTTERPAGVARTRSARLRGLRDLPPLCKRRKRVRAPRIFCSVVRRVWDNLNGSGTEWWPGWVGPAHSHTELHQRVLKFCHSIAFLTCAIGQVRLPNEDTGVRLLLKQVIGYYPTSPLTLEHVDVPDDGLGTGSSTEAICG